MREQLGMKNTRHGFTLLEVLVVVVIIMLLMTIVFKLSKATANVGEKATTVRLLHALSAAIEEFHSEYGIYPPTSSMDLQYPVLRGSVNKKQGVVDSHITHDNIEEMFEFGLLYYLAFHYGDETPASRVKAVYDKIGSSSSRRKILDDTVWSEHFGDSWDEDFSMPERDSNFGKRIKSFLDEFNSVPSHPHLETDFVGGLDESGNPSANAKDNCLLMRVWDGWGRDFHYICKPPYTSYILFSPGQDGAYDESDPLDTSKKANKDNIYGGVGSI